MTIFLYIENCIFQHDSFSALRFCLAFKQLTRALNNTSYGYSIERDKGEYQLDYFLHIDDLKLFSSLKTKLQSYLDITMQF